MRKIERRKELGRPPHSRLNANGDGKYQANGRCQYNHWGSSGDTGRQRDSADLQSGVRLRSGGSEFQYDRDHPGAIGYPFGGGSGGGVSITPVAFLVVGKQGIRSIPLENSTHLYDRILDSVPQFVDKLQSMFSKKDDTSLHSTTVVARVEESDLEDLMERS